MPFKIVREDITKIKCDAIVNPTNEDLYPGGGIASVVLCFYLPFTQSANATDGIFYFVAQLVQRSSEAFAGLGAFAGIVARVVAGLVLAIFAIIAFVLLNIFLKKCCNWVEKLAPTRVIDGCLATVLYAALGVVAAFAIWFVLAGLDYLNIVNFREALAPHATLAKSILDFVKTTLEGVLVPIAG